MRKRTVQIKLIKDAKKGVSATLPNDQEMKDVEITVDAIGRAIDRTIRTIGVAAVGYVVLDTLRQVMIAKASGR